MLWVDTLKLNDEGEREFKSRWVIRGDKDPRKGLEVATDPCPPENIRFMLLAALSSTGFDPSFISTIDVDNAFLQAPMSDTVYVIPPKEHPDHGKAFWLLQKCMYGLTESPLLFQRYLESKLIKHGWGKSPLRGIWWKLSKEAEVVALNGPAASHLQEIMREVECKEIQPLQRYVGVSYDVSQDEIWCSQEMYASSLNDRGVRPLVNPIPDAARKQADTSLPLNKKETKAFQQSLGELSYLASFTRPDLAYGTSHMAQWNAAPTVNAFAWLQRLVS
uniref:Reverse transcriptase Ty1/copia-type domain-containing protein n=1 Tax=Chromera velia CCMP2878 TaxID=1169474 RepID=A0A0G4I512_9ALVE|eukprot:Cvel_35967.t1-p1 / transcript=Cvel_35967.t1 / gene=Cvel_35967 / organism=Chromera_velia_CCMP2878 / gene_product=Putative transposon Ty5-1 protein YCL074W, putative / transcript_product=Putative transposon Ty5-1 protein YCL074W, putative / location=Cvel_scaffold6831:920-1744(-) / protein_length=275 / sequence_SO=supercontig / SO=protein_coding / is_pseudo=false